MNNDIALECIATQLFNYQESLCGGVLFAKLKQWAREELKNGSRVKAAHIDRVADKVMTRYRSK